MKTEEEYNAEVLQLMRDLYPTLKGEEKERAERLFPELKESEDEKMKKAIITALSSKRAEDIIESKYNIKMLDVIAWFEKQDEQKHEWSEEDNDTITDAAFYLRRYAELVNGGNSKQYVLDLANRIEDIEPKRHWKPSDEQMKAIRLARSFVVDDFDEHPVLSETLVEIEEQLKKLRKE